MKAETSVYLEAARRIAQVDQWYCCGALKAVSAPGDRMPQLLFAQLFRQPRVYGLMDYGWWGCPCNESNQDARVLALCLAHEIYES